MNFTSFVALSATIPNIFDVGAWLECKPFAIKSYGEDHRPVKVCCLQFW